MSGGVKTVTKSGLLPYLRPNQCLIFAGENGCLSQGFSSYLLRLAVVGILLFGPAFYHVGP